MDAATQLMITGLLYTLILPLGVAAVVLVGGHRLRPGAPRLFTGVAVVAGLATAFVGISGAPASPMPADGWLLVGPLVAGLLALALDGAGERLGAAAPWIGGALAALATGFFGWQVAGSLASAFTGGYAGPLAGSLWVVDALVVGAVVWIALQRALAAGAGDANPTPIVLGGLALTLVGAAACTALTGSVRIGQTLGGFAAVVGAVGLAGWRWPSVAAVGHGAVAAATLAIGLGLVYAHHFVEVPRPVATLLLLAPLGAVAGVGVGRSLGRTLPAVGVALGLTAALVGAAAGLTGLNEQVKADAVEARDGGDDGSYYPY